MAAQLATVSGSASTWYCIDQALGPTRMACTSHSGEEASTAAPSGSRSTHTECHCRAWPRSAIPAKIGSARPSAVSSTSSTPISGGRCHPQAPPRASASN